MVELRVIPSSKATNDVENNRTPIQSNDPNRREDFRLLLPLSSVVAATIEQIPQKVERKKSHRQLNSFITAPANSGPIAAPIPTTLIYNPNAFPRSLGPNTETTIAIVLP